MFLRIWPSGVMFGKGDIHDPDWVWCSSWLWFIIPAIVIGVIVLLITN